MSISHAQCRAARGLLGLSQEALAEAAGVGLSTVRDLETQRREVSTDLLAKIRVALEAQGAELLAADSAGGEGVRLRKRRGRSR